MATKANKLVEWLALGEIDWDSDTFSLRLSNAASPDLTAINATGIAELATVNGYIVGGQAITMATPTSSGATTTLPSGATAQTLEWTSTGTLSAYGAWIYDDTASRPISYISFGGQVTKTTGQILAVYIPAGLAVGRFDA